MYSTWRVAQLKTELKKRGASLRGKKSDLVERLEAYDRNFNFESVCDNSPESQMEFPEEETFRDVNSSSILPPLTREHIHLYFNRFNKKTDDGCHLYEARYLLVLRSCTVGDYTFLKGICKASMKRIQYETNIKLLKNGSIEETTCECAVGSGKEAHCKHIAISLFAAEQMYREKMMLLHIVCTQELQTFHKPKKVYTASPLKAAKRNMGNIIFHPYPIDSLNKENYNARVRNICIGARRSTMPLKQMFSPANPYALLNDHDYPGKDSRDVLCEQLYLSKITQTEIINIEIKTRGQIKNPIWHEMRQNRLTASRFHTICHLTEGRQEKFAEQLLMPHFKSRATTHGIINEPAALKIYSQTYDINIKECGLFISETYPFLGASPDGLLGEETIIEIKCPYATRNREISEISVPYLYRENGELFLKKSCIYYYQIQGQLFCTDKKFCNLIIYTFKDMKLIYIPRDENFINVMVGKLVAFYENYFKKAVLNKYIFKNYK